MAVDQGAGLRSRVSSLSSPRRATAVIALDPRARDRAIGAVYTTIASDGLKPRARSPCSHRRIGRHRSAFSRWTDAALGASQGGFQLHRVTLLCTGGAAPCPAARLRRRASCPEMEWTARAVGCRSRRSVGGLKSLAASRARWSLSHHPSIGLAQLGQLGSLKPRDAQRAISPRGPSEIE